MSNMFSLEGKIALVTGASYGIGFAIACAMTRRRRDHRIQRHQAGTWSTRALAAYAEKGIKAHGYVCDVTDEAAGQRARRQD